MFSPNCYYKYVIVKSHIVHPCLCVEGARIVAHVCGDSPRGCISPVGLAPRGKAIQQHELAIRREVLVGSSQGIPIMHCFRWQLC